MGDISNFTFLRRFGAAQESDEGAVVTWGEAVGGGCWQLMQWNKSRDEEDALKLYLEINVHAF